MLTAWCMFDNHAFARVELSSKKDIIQRVKTLQAKMKGASLFVSDGAVELGQRGMFEPSPFELMDVDTASDLEIEEWVQNVLKEVAFQKLMDG